MNTNLALLTRAHGAVAAKKRARKDQIKEVVFDDDARREFLTGFHKRKLAKAEAARAKAKEREKQDRLEARRDQRRMLREQAAENASQVEKAYGATIDDGDEDDDAEWSGISQREATRDDEYEDEEMLATVTVVEDFDPDTIIHGPSKADIPTHTDPTASASSSSHPPSRTTKTPDASGKRPSKPKVRERKVRYETKDARKREQIKQRKRRTEKAERAGGKASRKPSGSKKHGARR
ncbi:nucleolar protein 12-domain-containing protein [Pholiota molesta]|nr:nucleolar protein 12-domain-containing protein [Pholiota molesta]